MYEQTEGAPDPYEGWNIDAIPEASTPRRSEWDEDNDDDSYPIW